MSARRNPIASPASCAWQAAHVSEPAEQDSFTQKVYEPQTPTDPVFLTRLSVTVSVTCLAGSNHLQ